MKHCILASLAIAVLAAIAAYGTDHYSNGTGGGLFNDVNTWSNGTVPSAGSDQYFILSGDTVTMPAGYSYNNQNRQSYIDGMLVCEAGSTTVIRRMYATPYNQGGGGINCSGLYSCARMYPAAPFTVNLYEGEFEIRDGIAITTPSFNLYAGRFTHGSAIGAMLIDGAIYDSRNQSTSFNGGLTWNSGTIVNWNIQSNTERGKVNDNFKYNCILDVCDQTHTNLPVNFDFGTVPFQFTTGGVVQIDVYSSTADDCDKLVTTSLASMIATNVVFQIGDGGGLPGTFNDYASKSYQVLVATNAAGSTGYGDCTPTVPFLVTWKIGGVDRSVGLINNIATDGTIQVIPEPATVMAAVVLLALLRRSTK